MDYLPEGMTLMADNDGTVTVTVEIYEQSQKQLTLPASDLHLVGQENGKDYTVHGDAHITITGEEHALDKIKANDLKGTIYVNNLSAGDHKVMVHADLPDGISMNPSYITVTVKDASASNEE
jgi:YbbR domain-containing protein